MATSVELREMAHEVYARARASLDPSIKQQLLRLADDYLKQADELRRADVIQAAFPKPDRNIG
jgi:Holliday junction resolvase-like predicted endonuclease